MVCFHVIDRHRMCLLKYIFDQSLENKLYLINYFFLNRQEGAGVCQVHTSDTRPRAN